MCHHYNYAARADLLINLWQGRVNGASVHFKGSAFERHTSLVHWFTDLHPHLFHMHLLCNFLGRENAIDIIHRDLDVELRQHRLEGAPARSIEILLTDLKVHTEELSAVMITCRRMHMAGYRLGLVRMNMLDGTMNVASAKVPHNPWRLAVEGEDARRLCLPRCF